MLDGVDDTILPDRLIKSLLACSEDRATLGSDLRRRGR
jgi:hypothetical protein